MHKYALARIGAILLATCLNSGNIISAPFSVANEAQLEAAILAANANDQDDVITLSANIAVTGAFINNIGFGPNGFTPIGPDVGISGVRHSITILGAGFSITRTPTLLPPNDLYRIFEVAQTGNFGGHLILQDVTIANGNPGSFDGGAILVDATGLIDASNNVRFNNNTSNTEGGAVAISANANLGTFQSTIFTGNSANFGGAIVINGTATLITRCEFSGNTALSFGGALALFGTLATLSDSNFAHNQAEAGGGAVWVFFGGLVNSIANTAFTNNLTSVGAVGGGALGVSGVVQSIDGSDFLGNFSSTGGAIWIGDRLIPAQDPGTINSINNTLFRGNIATELGGAIRGEQTELTGRPVVVGAITSSRFESNLAVNLGGGAISLFSAKINLIDTSSFQLNIGGETAQTNPAGGGAIYLQGADLGTVENSAFSFNATAGSGGAVLLQRFETLVSNIERLANSTLSNNSAGGVGGAIAFTAAAAPLTVMQLLGPSIILFLSNDTIADNTALSGGGIFMGSTADLGLILNFWSTIVAQNSLIGVGGSGPDVFNLSATITNEDYNLIGNNQGSTFIAGLPNANNSYVGTQANPVDPRLGPLADNGGKTLTRALLTAGPASIAIDHGANPLLYLYDQRGPNFLRTSGVQTDIGAYEVQQLCPGCPLCPPCPSKDCRCKKNKGCHHDGLHDRDDEHGDLNHHDNNSSEDDNDNLSTELSRGLQARTHIATPHAATLETVKPQTESVSVEAKQVNASAGSASDEPVDLEEAGGCSSIGGMGQHSTNLTLLLLTLLGGFRTLRSRKAKKLPA